MCGIAGFLGSKSTTISHISEAMGKTLHHRGPDDQGIWLDQNFGLALIHTRLSIIDLSSAGHQPMHSQNGRFVIAFNGEIYNHNTLRKELNIAWKGHSDTETLLAAIEAWGIEKTLQKSVGMFAISLWDKKDKLLYLARDRMGEKPLYYGFQNNVFMFASELKALKQHPSFIGKINRNAIMLQMTHNYIPEPWSIYEGISKLSAGTFAKIALDSQNISIIPYWTLKDHLHPSNSDLEQNPDKAIKNLETVLTSAIQEQMISDVPLGAFLSGGIDSSLVTAIMQSLTNVPVKTFTIGFDQPGYNEAEFAKSVAKHLKTEHTELYVSDQDALNIIPNLPKLYDEPFSDSSQIPTFLVSRMTKQHVTVALSGDGADELFGGYNRYFWANSIHKRLKLLPSPLRYSLSNIMRLPSADAINAASESLAPLLPKRFRYKNAGDKLHKLSKLLTLNSKEDLYLHLISHWNATENIVINTQPVSAIYERFQEADHLDFTHQMMYTDAMTYLTGDILTKVDRAAMGVSLETRAPYLDHRVVEAAWQLPLSLKIKSGTGKWILRQILYKHVPKELIERPKMGFGAPIGTWLKGPLRDWAEELLNEHRLVQEGYLNPLPIRKKWQEHLSGKRNWQYDLWDVLMFQAWLEKNNK